GNPEQKAWAPILWGALLFDQGRYDAATEKFKLAAENKLMAYKAHCNLAGTALEQGLNRQAMTYVEIAIRNKPNLGEAYAMRGTIECKSGEYTNGMADFAKAIALDSRCFLAYVNRAKTRFDRKDYMGSLEDDNKAIALDPTIAKVFFNRGNVFIALGDHKRAAIDFGRAIELEPVHWEYYSWRGQA